MRPTILLLSAAALLLMSADADAGRKKKKGGDGDAAAPATADVTPDVPDDKNSEKFAEGLLSKTIQGFAPIDAGANVRFMYNELSFSPDNTWKASGYVEMMGEQMECTEIGVWSMDPAESATVATMTWKVERTDCINQNNGDERRYRVTLQAEGISVAYR
ncbi:MAG: hypothetical protein AAFV53_22810 [Myxococcota bacterium]